MSGADFNRVARLLRERAKLDLELADAFDGGAQSPVEATNAPPPAPRRRPQRAPYVPKTPVSEEDLKRAEARARRLGINMDPR